MHIHQGLGDVSAEDTQLALIICTVDHIGVSHAPYCTPWSPSETLRDLGATLKIRPFYLDKVVNTAAPEGCTLYREDPYNGRRRQDIRHFS